MMGTLEGVGEPEFNLTRLFIISFTFFTKSFATGTWTTVFRLYVVSRIAIRIVMVNGSLD
jgi:hypothetical protein